MQYRDFWMDFSSQNSGRLAKLTVIHVKLLKMIEAAGFY